MKNETIQYLGYLRAMLAGDFDRWKHDHTYHRPPLTSEQLEPIVEMMDDFADFMRAFAMAVMAAAEETAAAMRQLGRRA